MVSGKPYDAIVVMSPMYENGEKKDQDRAVWHHQCQNACVLDGVTTSPYSDKAATIGANFSPVLFSRDPETTLGILSDLLVKMRKEKLNSNIKMPAGISENMREILYEAAQDNLTRSFQTTLVAMNLETEDDGVEVSVIRCGDSSLVAFSDRGQVLMSTPSPEHEEVKKKDNSPGCFEFRPGDELFAKVIAGLEKFADAGEFTDICEEYRKNWLFCSVIDKCSSSRAGSLPGIKLRFHDKVVVPRFLAGNASKVGNQMYVSFPYSRNIRIINRNARTIGRRFTGGNLTEVLPDHFYTGQWVYFIDKVPLGSHFVLGSDGFTGCFSDHSEMWWWLNRYRPYLAKENTKRLLLKKLHADLRKKCGDDDISFVWVYPSGKEGV